MTQRTGGAAAVAEGRRYRQLFEAAPVGLVITDCAGRVREANATFCATIGRRRALLEGHQLASLVTLDGRRGFREALARMASEPGPFDLTFSVIRRGGARTFLTATVRVELADSGTAHERVLYWALADDRRAGDEDML